MTVTVLSSGKQDVVQDAYLELEACSQRSVKRHRVLEGVGKGLLGLCAFVVSAVFLFFLGVLFVKAFAGVSAPLVFRTILPLLWNSLLLTAISILMVLPYAIGSALYCVEIAPDSLPGLLGERAIEYIGCIPIPVVAYAFVIYGGGLKWKLLAGCVAGAFMAYPMLYSALADRIRSIPLSVREASRAFGASRMTTAVTVVLPLTLRSCIGEVARVAGVICAEVTLFSALLGSGVSAAGGLNEPVRTLGVHVFFSAQQGGSLNEAFVCGAALLLLVWSFGLWSYRFTDKRRKKAAGKEVAYEGK